MNKIKNLWSKLTEKKDSIYLVIGVIVAVIAIVIQIVFGGKFSLVSGLCGLFCSAAFLGYCYSENIKVCEPIGIFGISLIYFAALIILTLAIPRGWGLFASWIIWEILVCTRSPEDSLMLVMVGFCAYLVALCVPFGFLILPYM